MSNNLAGLNGYLDTALADTADTTWTSDEKNNVLTWVVAGLYPRLARPLDPQAASSTVTLVADTYFYALDTSIMDVSKIAFVDSDDNEGGFLDSDSWEITGSQLAGTAYVHVAPAFVDANAGGTLRLYGYGRYDTSTNLVPDDYVPLVIALARAECYRRLVGDRARFREWLSRQQTQNISVNEALQMVNEADNEAAKLRASFKTWRRPVAGRIG